MLERQETYMCHASYGPGGFSVESAPPLPIRKGIKGGQRFALLRQEASCRGRKLKVEPGVTTL
ncbi:hypothetical protein BT69DRAFT_1278309 [Atractiella rhizophila]|nr:hypothetical protein BT69DRAFT_1278309 [Atractiella rhizophila]